MVSHYRQICRTTMWRKLWRKSLNLTPGDPREENECVSIKAGQQCGQVTKNETQGGLSRAENHSNGNVFMIAGTETTATGLSGTTFLLLTHPEVLKKLTAEIRSTISSPDELGLEVLARMKYLQAVLQEGLRLYPPAPIDLPREVSKGGAVVDGHFLPAGTKIGIGHYATYRLPLYFKHADQFHPERWLGDPEYKDDNLGAVEPFSIGPRNCLGKVRQTCKRRPS